MRVIELDVASAEGLLSTSQATALKQTMERNGGWAGDAFLRYLVQPEVLAWVKEMLPKVAHSIETKGNFTKKHRYWVRLLAVAWIAADLVRRQGLVDFSSDRVINWAIRHLGVEAKYEVETPGNFGHEPARGDYIMALANFLNENIDSTLPMPGPYKPGDAIVPAGKFMRRLFIRYEQRTNRYFISQGMFKDYLLTRDIQFKHLVQDLMRAGVVAFFDRQIKLGAGTDMPGGLVTCFAVDAGHPEFSGEIREVPRVIEPIGRVR